MEAKPIIIQAAERNYDLGQKTQDIDVLFDVGFEPTTSINGQYMT